MNTKNVIIGLLLILVAIETACIITQDIPEPPVPCQWYPMSWDESEAMILVAHMIEAEFPEDREHKASEVECQKWADSINQFIEVHHEGIGMPIELHIALVMDELFTNSGLAINYLWPRELDQDLTYYTDQKDR